MSVRLLEFFRPYRIICSRRVSEEEQVSVELFAKTQGQCEVRLANILAVFREHRKRSNEEVVRATQQQLAALDSAITARGAQLADLDEQIAKQRGELDRLRDIASGKARKLGLSPGTSVADLVRPGNGQA